MADLQTIKINELIEAPEVLTTDYTVVQKTTGTYKMPVGKLKGAKGDTPEIRIGNTTTLPPGSGANVTQRGNLGVPIFDFAIPTGLQGPKGEKGDLPDITPLKNEIEYKFGELTSKQQQDSEVVDARDGELSLNIRLNKDNQKIEDSINNLKYKVNYVDKRNLALNFGKIDLPTDFNKNEDFEIYRDSDGSIKTTYRLENFFNIEKTIYLSEQGRDSNDGLTKATSLRTLSKAIEVAQSQNENYISINILNECFSGGGAGSGLNISLSKNILIQPDESIKRSFVGSFSRNDDNGIQWNDEGNGVYSYNYTEVPKYILDRGILDYRGIPKELQRLNDNSQSLSNGNWVVNTINKKILIKPFKYFKKENIINISTHNKNVFSLNDKVLAFKNIDFLYCSDVSNIDNRGYGGIEIKNGRERSTFIFENCSSSYAFRNGIYVDDINYSYIINSTCSNNGADGFNYDGRKNGKPYEFIIEYNCHSYNNGRLRNSDGTNNATTGHGGVHILRIGCIGYGSDGPTCADVQGCYSILFDCHMRDNTTEYPGSETDSSFYFDNKNQVTGNGKAILINCSSIKDDLGYGLSTDGKMDLYVRNFNGKIKDGIPIKYI